SPLEFDRLDRCSAPAAGLALATVDLELRLELARLAEQVHVGLVVQRGPPEPDGFLDHFAHGSVQAADLLRGQRVAGPVLAKAGGEKYLVRVKFAQPPAHIL